MQPVTIYTTPTCPYCQRAKKLFNELGVQFEEIDVSQNQKLRDDLIKKHNWMTVPAIFINNELIGGYDDIAALHAEGKLMSKLKK